jgi:transcription antitermination factor NusG
MRICIVENNSLSENSEALSRIEDTAQCSKYWFAVFTSPRHEKRVAAHFVQREIESFLPTYQAIHRWKNGQTVYINLPLFPGYVFAHVGRRERVRLLSVPGVVTIVGAGREPTAVPDAEIESLRSSLHLRNVEPHPYLVVGERVRIKAGAMEGLEGILVRKKSHLRVVLTLELIRQSVAIELRADEVEPVL